MKLLLATCLPGCDGPPTVQVGKQSAGPYVVLTAERAVGMPERVFNLGQISGPSR